MNTEDQIREYIAGQPEKKRGELEELHRMISGIKPGIRLWFLDGKNSEGKVVSNPNIGYGELMMHYADGTSREFYRVGLSANTTGISVYIMGLEDKTYLSQTYGERLGKAGVSGYCIKFKSVKEIHTDVLEELIRGRLESDPK